MVEMASGNEPNEPPAPLQSQSNQQQEPNLQKQLEEAKKEAQRWKDGYAGLQKKYDPLQTQHTEVKTKLADLEALQAETNKQFDALKGTHQEVTQNVSTLEIDLLSARSKLARANLIMGKFPELATFEAEGLLPETAADADEDTIAKVFEAFTAKLKAMSETNKRNFSAGGTHPPPPDNKALSAVEELKLANTASAAGDSKGFDEHYSKYLELTKPT